MDKIAIVTGSSGQLWEVFVDVLVKDGFYVYAIDIKENLEKAPNKSVQQVSLDITNENLSIPKMELLF